MARFDFCVIFDMDGVIFDTERILIEYWKKTASKYGLDSIEETCLRCIGITEDESLRILQERYGGDLPIREYRDETFRAFRKHYERKALPTKPGVVPILSFLKHQGIPTALASSTPTVNVVNELKQANLIQFFDCITGGDSVTESKPSPQIFNYTAEKMNFAPEQCFVIEDSYNGLRAAANAHMHPIMVPDLLPVTSEMKMLAEEVHHNLFETMNFMKNVIRAN